jgi:aminomethyltransferase
MEFNEALKTVNFEYDHTPLELDLAWLVDFRKPHFNGRSALLRQSREGVKRKLLKLNIEGNKTTEESILYNNKACSHEVGYITSAMWSPAVKANIAFAFVDTKALGSEIWAEIYYYKELRPHRKMARCTIQDKPFWVHPRARQTPPGLS